ncbi:unnamed protein product [Blepharisma stoltei]|uniref:Transmembrane protein 230 n=1 Tax=Blepharisma stoltei TaxID=1481888 RepID=A0AAU9JC59_9CILI|nr:unnamed protein product [Blepharisma stoltei]
MKPVHNAHESFDIIGDELRQGVNNSSDLTPIEIADIQLETGISQESTAIPKKTLVASILLFIIGSILIVVGCVEEYVLYDKSQGLAMLVVGSITFIPGMYYSYLFYKVYKAKTLVERMRILREIPDMS